jgi:hypothetical protein
VGTPLRIVSRIRAAKSIFWRTLAETKYKMAYKYTGMSSLLSLNRRFIHIICRVQFFFDFRIDLSCSYTHTPS